MTDDENIYMQFMHGVWGTVFGSHVAVGPDPFYGIGRRIRSGYVEQLNSICTAEVLEDLEDVFGRFLNGFPEITIKTDTPGFSSGKISADWHFEGTHDGEIINTKPTGKRVKWSCIAHITVQEGKITRIGWTWQRPTISDQIKPPKE